MRKLYVKEKCPHCEGKGVRLVLDGPKYRREREVRRIGLRQAANLADVSPTHLSDIEKGRRVASSELAVKLVLLLKY